MVDDRRIGERVAVGAMQLTWEPVVNDDTGATSGESQQALLMDVSVTGAGLFAPSDPIANVGDLFIICFNEARAVVEVRRFSRTDDTDLHYYGVQFVAMERSFEREVFAVIARCP